MDTFDRPNTIIPISKLLGNYNVFILVIMSIKIIPISKLLGNYNPRMQSLRLRDIIPISKLLGNYNFQNV